MGLSPVKGLFALAGQLICDCAFQISYEGELFFVGKAWRRASAPSPAAVCCCWKPA